MKNQKIPSPSFFPPFKLSLSKGTSFPFLKVKRLKGNEHIAVAG